MPNKQDLKKNETKRKVIATWLTFVQEDHLIKMLCPKNMSCRGTEKEN